VDAVRKVLRLYGWFMAGTMLAALVAKLTLHSRGEPSSEEVDLVSIFDGIHLVSEADPFYGGKVMSVFGGILLDLRKAQPSPTGVHLDVIVIWGGLSVVVPPGWMVRNEADVFAGGYEDRAQPSADPDSPVVRITGKVIMGGLQVTTKSTVEAVT